MDRVIVYMYSSVQYSPHSLVLDGVVPGGEEVRGEGAGRGGGALSLEVSLAERQLQRAGHARAQRRLRIQHHRRT